MQRVRQLVPSLVTVLALSCGVASVDAAQRGDGEQALRLILLAAIADGADGALARALRVTSSLGEHLDSLADVVAFGVAPAFLFGSYFGDLPIVLRLAVQLAFVQAAAYRLARFHAQPQPAGFLGLPITVAGALWAALVTGPLAGSAVLAAAAALILGWLMVCRHPFPKLAPSSPRLTGVLGGLAILVAVGAAVETAALVSVMALGGYVSWVLFAGAVRGALPLGAHARAARAADGP